MSTQIFHPPLLMLPPIDNKHPDSCSFFRLKSRSYTLITDLPSPFPDSRCVGSSHGYLVLLDQDSNPSLFNPLDRHRVPLPPLETFPCILGFLRAPNGVLCARYRTRPLGLTETTSLVPVESLRDFFIRKAILTSPPRRHEMDEAGCLVVLICGDDSRLVFARPGDPSWTEFPESCRWSYQDIICRSGRLYALSNKGFVRAWDVNEEFPVQLTEVKSPFPRKPAELMPSTRDLYSSNIYLAEAAGRLLLAVRIIGEFVNWDGVPIKEGDLISDADIHPLVCPYRTLKFHVYVLDEKPEEWAEVDSIDGRTLFLGGSESMSVSAENFPECEQDSIYFTDDYWERVNEDYLYGGHDMGVYNIRTGCIKPFCELDSDKIKPPPFWVMPTNPDPPSKL